MSFADKHPAGQWPETALEDPFWSMSLADITVLAQEQGQNGSLWYEFCKQYGIYEYPTAEYVAAFSDYLNGRVGELMSRKDGPIKVLEIGAGNGRLAHALAPRLYGVEFNVTDSYKWKLPGLRSPLVQQMEAREALATYQPDIVIACWVPSDEMDWTSGIRALPSVQEYLLIGEPLGHATGSAWGLIHDGGELHKIDEPAYERDGFERLDLMYLKGLQASRYDGIGLRGLTHRSITASFRRKGIN